MKKIIVLFLILSLAMGTNVQASDTNGKDVEKIMLDYGYTQDIIDVTPEDEKKEVAYLIQNSPEKIQMQISTTEIDEISTIEYVVNSSDKDLMKDGFDEKDILKLRKKIDEVNKMSDKEIEENFGKSNAEIKIWRRALKKNPNYKKTKKEGNIVTTSGTISSSDLTYSQTVYDNSNSTGKAVSYRAYSTFNWHDTYFWDTFMDQVVFGWGGNLATDDISHSVTYTSGKDYIWNNQIESPANAGLKFEAYQSTFDPSYSQIKSGYTGVTLYQNQIQNYDTKVLSSYGHKMLALAAGIGVSASGPSVNLTFSTGFHYSPQESDPITY